MLAYYAIVTLHVLVCLILVLVVLLQSGKGADLAGAFGGGGTQTAFGSRGPASFLSKVTTGAAVVFMITSIALSGMTTSRISKSIMDSTKGPAVPVSKAPAPATTTPGKVLSPEEIQKRVEELEKQGTTKAPAQPAASPVSQTPVPEKKGAPGKSPS